MRILSAAIIAAFVAASMPVASADSHWKSCDILIGGPHTSFLALAEAGLEGIDGCVFEVDGLAGQTMSTVTTDGAGAGYDIDLWFWTASGSFIQGTTCATANADESCTIPTDAATVSVTAWLGALLIVDIHVTQ